MGRAARVRGRAVAGRLASGGAARGGYSPGAQPASRSAYSDGKPYCGRMRSMRWLACRICGANGCFNRMDACYYKYIYFNWFFNSYYN